MTLKRSDNFYDPFGLKKTAKATFRGSNHIRFLGVYVALGLVLSFLVLASLAPQVGEKLGEYAVRKQHQESLAYRVGSEGGRSTADKPPCQFRLGNDPIVAPGYGDVNLDGKVNPVDALYAKRLDAGYSINVPSSKLVYAYEAADVNDSPYIKSSKSDVDITDALLIERYSAGLIKSFPACGNSFGLFNVN